MSERSGLSALGGAQLPVQALPLRMPERGMRSGMPRPAMRGGGMMHKF